MQVRGPLFDVHCHLQDPRVFQCAPKLLGSAREAGVQWLAVNGTSEVQFAFPRTRRSGWLVVRGGADEVYFSRTTGTW